MRWRRARAGFACAGAAREGAWRSSRRGSRHCNAGGEDRGGIVSGFTGGFMGGCWIGSVGIVLGVCLAEV